MPRPYPNGLARPPMPAALIDGKKIASEIKDEVKLETDKLKASRKITPGLAFILVGDNPAPRAYVKMRGRGGGEMGFYSTTKNPPADTTEARLLELIGRFN